MKKVTTEEHYDLLIQEGNDPANDPPALQDYMNQWDGQTFIDALALTPNSNVLEIGVGTGRLAKKFLCVGCRHFTGIDISSATIDRAMENLSDWDNISLIHADFINYHFLKTFDVVYCSLTLFHFEDKRSFIQKAARIIPKGRIVLSIPKVKESSINLGSREVELYPDDLDSIRALLKGEGFATHDVLEVEFAYILVAE